MSRGARVVSPSICVTAYAATSPYVQVTRREEAASDGAREMKPKLLRTVRAQLFVEGTAF
ncbi:MAG: hypothetical protein ACXVIR_07725 [Halobacteriota archaeon]